MGTNWSGKAFLPGAVTKALSGRKKPGSVTEKLAPSEILWDKANHKRRKHNKGNPTNVTSSQVQSISISFLNVPGSRKTMTFSFFCQALWTNVLLRLLLTRLKNEVIRGFHFAWVNTKPHWSPADTYRSQWADEEFYCKSSPWGIVGILQKSSYSRCWSISKLPICKIWLRLNSTFKSDTWTRRLRSPGDTPTVCAGKHKWKGIRGKRKGRKIKTD